MPDELALLKGRTETVPSTAKPKPESAPKPAAIPVDVANSAYEGATMEMVGRALLQRPPKDKETAGKTKDEDQSDG